jgi:hypothetical protein
VKAANKERIKDDDGHQITHLKSIGGTEFVGNEKELVFFNCQCKEIP